MAASNNKKLVDGLVYDLMHKPIVKHEYVRGRRKGKGRGKKKGGGGEGGGSKKQCMLVSSFIINFIFFTDGSGFGSGWFLDNFVVTAENTNKQWIFNCGR